ncbi:hypothetical protein D5018_19390 [Parashewanella curva]|uniref:DUF6475 domain-containing protein n=1 Tax=Parashewanella curva TaxID=2338552 RepID=A0A3L8PTV9_9GAMM|nr:DUF6475 domain-containing protein [Parashewanella curva]RLV58033.1 hypothetical protein D5018_19390 [Parashewanella curva]
MTEQDKAEFAHVWCASWSLYDKVVTDDVLSMSFEALCQYSIEQIKSALSHHIRSTSAGQFAPRPADVIKHIPSSPHSQAVQAWEQMNYAIHRVGAWNSVYFQDPLLTLCITKLGGWVKMCRLTEWQLERLQNTFIDSYLSLAESTHSEILNTPLLGIIDNQNRNQSLPVDVMAVVSEQHQCRIKQQRMALPTNNKPLPFNTNN